MTRIHRIFSEQPLEKGKTVSLPDDVAHYLSRVLRLSVGQSLCVFNGDGSDYLAEVARLERGRVSLRVLSCQHVCTESSLEIILVQAISRGERMDLTIQKATELGVSAFQPVFSARTEVHLTANKMERRMEHWRKVVVSACEQSGRSRLPAVYTPLDLQVWAQQESQAQRIVLTPGAPDSLAGMACLSTVELVVGPEGGFEEQELASLVKNGGLPASLGPRILRTETAGPTAIAILQALGGDLA